MERVCLFQVKIWSYANGIKTMRQKHIYAKDINDAEKMIAEWFRRHFDEELDGVQAEPIIPLEGLIL